jgi:hypothetical protein
MFPVLPLSPCGHDDPPTLQPLDVAGQVHSWTRMATQGEPDTLLAMVDFLDGQLRVIAPVVGVDEIRIGDRLWLTTSDIHPYELRPRPADGRSDTV